MRCTRRALIPPPLPFMLEPVHPARHPQQQHRPQCHRPRSGGRSSRCSAWSEAEERGVACGRRGGAAMDQLRAAFLDKRAIEAGAGEFEVKTWPERETSTSGCLEHMAEDWEDDTKQTSGGTELLESVRAAAGTPVPVSCQVRGEVEASPRSRARRSRVGGWRSASAAWGRATGAPRSCRASAAA